MDKILQYILIVCSFLFCLYILRKTNKKKLSYKHSMLWLTFGIITLLCSIFPNIINRISSILHIAEPTNALFLIYIFLIIVVCFYLTTTVSKLLEKTTILIQRNAILEGKIEDLLKENKNDKNN